MYIATVALKKKLRVEWVVVVDPLLSCVAWGAWWLGIHMSIMMVWCSIFFLYTNVYIASGKKKQRKDGSK